VQLAREQCEWTYLFRGQARGARDDPPLSARTLLDR
jgi:hypothetical protein